MRKARAHSESQQVDLYPEKRECPECHSELKERYHKQRWIIQLKQELKVKSHYLECRNRDCGLREAIYRPEQEGILALPGYNFGLDVVARIGELRYRDNLSLAKIATQLRLEAKLQISIKEVELLCEVFLALVTTVASQDQILMEELKKSGGIVLAIDGIQPEKSNETLYILRDMRSGRVLVAQNLLSSASSEIEKLIEEVMALGLPILGVISDKQDSIRLAVESKLAGVPHQICHYHYLKDLAQPVSEMDRHLKKELKKKIRGVRDVERKAQESTGSEAQVVADYCLAIRTVMGDDGKYPLEPPGVKLYENLQLISNSIERANQARPSSLLQKLLRMLTVLNLFEKEYKQLILLFNWIRQIAHLLKAETDPAEPSEELIVAAQKSNLSTTTHETNPEEAKKGLIGFIKNLKRFKQVRTNLELLALVYHFEKITFSFAPYLFQFLAQPLLPRTNNELELFIGKMKKSRRQITGRKNIHNFILREGSFVAILFGLPQPNNWLESFSRANIDDFHRQLELLRQTDMRSKRWYVRKDLAAYLNSLEELWHSQELVLQR
jgi:hypothetical protein